MEAHSVSSTPQGTSVERFKYDDGIVRMFLFATYGWALVAFLAGLYIALQLPFPSLSFGSEYLTFGRLRPLHTNAAIFAFAGQRDLRRRCTTRPSRLCKAPDVVSDVLSRTCNFWGWQADHPLRLRSRYQWA